MTEDARNSIFAWVSVVLFIGSVALTAKFLSEPLQSIWSPVYSGVAAFACFYYLARHFWSRRQRSKDQTNG